MKSLRYFFIFIMALGTLTSIGAPFSSAAPAPLTGGPVIGTLRETTTDNSLLSRTFEFSSDATCPIRAQDPNPAFIAYDTFHFGTGSVTNLAGATVGGDMWSNPNFPSAAPDSPSITVTVSLPQDTPDGTYTLSVKGTLTGRCHDYDDYDVSWTVSGLDSFTLKKSTQPSTTGTILFSAKTSDGRSSSQSANVTIEKIGGGFSADVSDSIGGDSSIASNNAPIGDYFALGATPSINVGGLIYTFSDSNSIWPNGANLTGGGSIEYQAMYVQPKLNLDAYYTAQPCYDSKFKFTPFGTEKDKVHFNITNPNGNQLNFTPGSYDVTVAGDYTVNDVTSSDPKYTLCWFDPLSVNIGGSKTIGAYFSTATEQPGAIVVSATQFCQDADFVTASLSWTPSSGATGYTIFRDGFVIAKVDGQTTTYNDRGLLKGTRYTYMIGGAGGSSPPGYVTLTTNSTCPPPSTCNLASSLVLSPSSQTTGVGGTVSFSALYDPDGPGGNTYGQWDVTSNTATTWTTDNANIASLGSSKGAYTGVSVGTTPIHASYCRTADGSVTVTQEKDFQLSISPSSRSVQRGDTATYTLSVSPLGGFTGTVALSLSNVAANISGSINPPSVVLGSGGSATVSLTPNQQAAIGTSRFTVVGTSGALSHSVQADINVYDSTLPTASLQANPTSILSGGSSTLTWSSTNADSCSINQGVGTVCSSSSACDSGGPDEQVSPLASTNYTLTCTNANGSATDNASVTVQSGSFSCDLSSSLSGTETTLTADIQNGSGDYRCRFIYGDGSSDMDYLSCPTRTYLYRGGPYTASVYVLDRNTSKTTSCETQVAEGDIQQTRSKLTFNFFRYDPDAKRWVGMNEWADFNDTFEFVVRKTLPDGSDRNLRLTKAYFTNPYSINVLTASRGTYQFVSFNIPTNYSFDHATYKLNNNSQEGGVTFTSDYDQYGDMNVYLNKTASILDIKGKVAKLDRRGDLDLNCQQLPSGRTVCSCDFNAAQYLSGLSVSFNGPNGPIDLASGSYQTSGGSSIPSGSYTVSSVNAPTGYRVITPDDCSSQSVGVNDNEESGGLFGRLSAYLKTKLETFAATTFPDLGYGPDTFLLSNAGADVYFTAYLAVSDNYCTLTATPGSILWGGSSVLQWSCSKPQGKTCSIDQGIGEVDPEGGTAAVKPKSNTTYTLQCSNVPDSPATVRVGFLPLLREIIPR